MINLIASLYVYFWDFSKNVTGIINLAVGIFQVSFVVYLTFKPKFYKETVSKRRCRNIIGKILNMTFNYLLPLTSFIICLC